MMKQEAGSPPPRVWRVPLSWPRLLTLAALVCLASVGLGALRLSDSSRTVASVNGEPIDAREFELAMLDQRALVLDEAQRRGASVGPDFWIRRTGGVVPLEEVRARALRTLTRRKIEQLIAKKAGLIDNLSYATLLNDLARENARRREVLARGGVIYGPTQYDEAGYNDYRQTNLVQTHLRGLAAKSRPSAELQAYYQAVKHRYYQRPDRVIVAEFTSTEQSSEKQTASRLEQARGALQAGVNPEVVARRFGLRLTRQTLDHGTARTWAMVRPRVLNAALSLPERGVSPVIDDSDRPVLLQMLDRRPGELLPYDVVQSDVRFRLSEAEYRQAVDEAVRSAYVTVNLERVAPLGREWWQP